jgi:hypothetical protein
MKTIHTNEIRARLREYMQFGTPQGRFGLVAEVTEERINAILGGDAMTKDEQLTIVEYTKWTPDPIRSEWRFWLAYSLALLLMPLWFVVAAVYDFACELRHKLTAR